MQSLLPAETPTGGRSLLWIALDKLGAGMDLDKTVKTMRDKEKRRPVAELLRDYANRYDRALELIDNAIAAIAKADRQL